MPTLFTILLAIAIFTALALYGLLRASRADLKAHMDRDMLRQSADQDRFNVADAAQSAARALARDLGEKYDAQTTRLYAVTQQRDELAARLARITQAVESREQHP